MAESGELEGLSPAGAARRDTMLRLLQGEVVRRGRRRRFARVAIAAAIPAIAAAAGIWAYRAGTVPPGAPPAEVVRPAPEVPAPAAPPEPVEPASRPLRIEVVRDDPTVVDRARIGDGELLALLASAGRPSGLIRAGGVVIVTDTPSRSR